MQRIIQPKTAIQEDRNRRKHSFLLWVFEKLVGEVVIATSEENKSVGGMMGKEGVVLMWGGVDFER